MLDIDADRRHPRKRHRPFAAGQLSIPTGFVLGLVLVAASLTIAAAAISWAVVLVVSLYIAVAMALLWFLCPLLLYWLSRTWFRAGRRDTHDDPLVEALRDPLSYVVGVLSAGVLLAAL